MKIFYISDLHICHTNIIEMCNRPFDSLEQMHEDMISKWNSVVSKNDVVRILGDVGFPRNQAEVDAILKVVRRLNGNKTLIEGNHDYRLLKDMRFRGLFSEIAPYMRSKDKDRLVILSHYPMEEWDAYFRGSYHAFGHVHTNDSNLKAIDRRYNVCYDAIDGVPRTLDWLIENRNTAVEVRIL